ncbi:hypothetical protein AB1Y20_023511 [Prymnesium parvum]|uniref:Glutathione transferase n=1 Tax=Prymnesium parvum TaxID=97485 RepID=A0AB34JGF8_PRYPA
MLTALRRGAPASTLPRLARSSATRPAKPVFFDMKHSNNAARVRLWLALTRCDEVEHRFVQYRELQTPAFIAVNPLKKVPALIRADGEAVFESSVILNYLEDKYNCLEDKEGEPHARSHFRPATPEARQLAELMCRLHDLYIASPNCTAPGFSHSQGAMYLSTRWHGRARGMDPATRAAKLAEIWQQLCWLESHAGSPFLVGGASHLTFADLTWFPTAVFMEFMLPSVFGWPAIFDPGAATPFPKLAAWYQGLKRTAPFDQVHADIWNYWVEMSEKGQFEPIREEIASNPFLKYQFGVTQKVVLHYQEPPPPGKQTGRYIGQPDRGDVVDEHLPCEVLLRDGRELHPTASLESMGFQLAFKPTACANFSDRKAIVETYYDEMIELIKDNSGADRVFIFDHTIRKSGQSNLNATGAGSAAPVPRVHCDYTADGAPRRMEQLGKEGIFSRLRGRNLTPEEVAELMEGRFAFINVWRSICDDGPVMQHPLAVCDERSVHSEDHFRYALRFPDRTGENYSLKFSDSHRWYSYPWMTKDECLIFKVYDKKVDGPRFVYHTAFQDPRSPPSALPRQSIEVRAIAFFDVPWASK